MKRIIIILILFISCKHSSETTIPPTYPPFKPENPDSIDIPTKSSNHRESKNYLKSKDYLKSEEWMISEEAALVELKLENAKGCIDYKEYGRAITVLREILEINPENDEAERLMKKAKNTVRSDVEEHYKKAYSYFKTKEYEKSMNKCEQALTLNPEHKPSISLMKENDILIKGKNVIHVVLQTNRLSKDIIEEIDKFFIKRYISEINKNRKTKYYIKIIKPKTNINYKILQINPSAGIEYKLRIIDPHTKKEVPGLAMKIPYKDLQQYKKEKRINQLLYEGVQKYRDEEYEEAIKLWKKVLKIDINNAKAKKYIARAEYKLQKLKKLEDKKEE